MHGAILLVLGAPPTIRVYADAVHAEGRVSVTRVAEMDEYKERSVGMNPHRIELGQVHDEWNGQWVEVKPWMSFAASARIAAARSSTPFVGDLESFRGIGDGAELKIDVTINPVEYAATFVDLQVLRWNVLGHDDEPLPAGRAGVMSDLAPVDVIDVIIDEMDKYYESLRPNFTTARSA